LVHPRRAGTHRGRQHPGGGEHLRRRPLRCAQALGYTIEDHDRIKLGIVEQLAARKPSTATPQTGRSAPASTAGTA